MKERGSKNKKERGSPTQEEKKKRSIASKGE